MKVTFFSNFLTHHQTPFCDAMYLQLKDDFTFVSTERMPQSFLLNGWPDCSDYIYNLKSYVDKANYNKAVQFGIDSDIVIIGSAPDNFICERIKKNMHTFRYSERFLRKGVRQLLDPRFLIYLLRCHTIYRNKNLYMLCASAYTANDLNLVFAYPKKKFKWGYFTEVKKIDIKKIIAQKPTERIEILWTARFIPLKHPELAVKLAYELKNKGYSFHLNMIGTGELVDPIKKLIKKKKLQDCVDILGSIQNPEVHTYMQKANIFLFTSDKREGWGAVLNEAMSNGCAVVASHLIGAVPFLINHQINGIIFKSGNLASIVRQTEKLIKNSTIRNELGVNAYYTLRNEWSPQKAAYNFLLIAESLLVGQVHIIDSGPCSIADNTKILIADEMF